MPEKNLLEQKKNNLMKALNRQGADYVPTMLASSCAEVAWTGQKVTDVIGDANAYVKAMTDVFEVMWGDANTFSGTLFTPAISDIIEPVQNKFGPCTDATDGARRVRSADRRSIWICCKCTSSKKISETV